MGFDVDDLLKRAAKITGTPYTPAPRPSPLTRDEDLAVRTIIGEAKGEGVRGWEGVADVIRNRAQKSGKSIADVVLAPNQFEPWGSRKKELEGYDLDSPDLRRITQAVLPVLRGERRGPAGDATHFYSPGSQSALGRKPPSWDNGKGIDIGNHRFFNLGYSGKGYHGTDAPSTPEFDIEDLLKRASAITSAVPETQTFDTDDLLRRAAAITGTPTIAGEPKNIPIAPEAPGTIAAQAQSAANPNTPRGMVLLNPGETPNPNDAQWHGFGAFNLPDKQVGDRVAMVNLEAAKKLKLRTPKDIQQFLNKNPNALERFGIHAETVQDTSKGAAVTTIDPVTGTELNSAIVTNPEAAKKQIALDQANHPGGQSQVVDAQDVVAARSGANQPTIEQEFETWITQNNLPRDNDSVAKFNAFKKQQVDDTNADIKLDNLAIDTANRIPELETIGTSIKEGVSADERLKAQAQIQKRFDDEKLRNPSLTVEAFNKTLGDEHTAAVEKSKAEWLKKNPQLKKFAEGEGVDPFDEKTIAKFNEVQAADAKRTQARKQKVAAVQAQSTATPTPTGDYDFVKKGELVVPGTVGQEPMRFGYDKANQGGLQKGEYRVSDEDGTAYIFSPTIGKFIDEADTQVLKVIDLAKPEKGPSISTAKRDVGHQIAEAIGDEYKIPKEDIIDFFAQYGLSDWETGEDLPEERYFGGMTDPLTGEKDNAKTEPFHLTQRTVNQLAAFSKERQASKATYDAAKQAYSDAGDDAFESDVKARKDAKWMRGSDADEELALYKKKKSEFNTYFDMPDPEGTARDEKTVKELTDNALAEIRQKYGSFRALDDENKRIAALPVSERVAEAARSLVAVIPKAIGSILKTGGALGYGLGKLGVLPSKTGGTIKDTPLYHAGEGWDFIGKWGENPAAHAAWESKTADTIGQVAINAAAAWATGGMTLPATIGLSQGASQAIDSAIKEGATPNQQLAQGVVGAVAAMPDLLIMKGWFKSFTGPERVGLVRKIGQSVYKQLVLKGATSAEASTIGKLAMTGFIERAGQLGQKILFSAEKESLKPLTAVSAAGKVLKGAMQEGIQEASENKINLIGKKYIQNPNITWTDITKITDDDVDSAVYGALGGAFGGGIEIASHPDAFKSYKDRKAAYAAIDAGLANHALEKNGDQTFTLGGREFEITDELADVIERYQANAAEIEQSLKGFADIKAKSKKTKSFAERRALVNESKALQKDIVALATERDELAARLINEADAGDALLADMAGTVEDSNSPQAKSETQPTSSITDETQAEHVSDTPINDPAALNRDLGRQPKKTVKPKAEVEKAIKESTVEAESPSKSLMEAVGETPGVQLDLEDYAPNHVLLSDIEATDKGKGLGSQVMERLVAEADKAGIEMSLQVAGDEGSPRFNRLVEFYERFGFTPDGEMMRRLPNPSKRSAVVKQSLTTENEPTVKDFLTVQPESQVDKKTPQTQGETMEGNLGAKEAVIAASKSDKIPVPTRSTKIPGAEIVGLVRRQGELSSRLKSERLKMLKASTLPSIKSGEPLAKVRTPESEQKLRDAAKKDFTPDEIAGIKSKVTQHGVELDEHGLEIANRIARHAGLGTKRFDGLFLDPQALQQFVTTADEFAAALGGDAGKAVTKMANAIEARFNKRGVATIYTYDDARIHEGLHEADYLGSLDEQGVSKSLERRYDGATEKLARSAPFKKFTAQLSARTGRDVSHGVSMAEAVAWLGDGRYAEFGLTESESVDILAELVTGYAQENGVESLKNFEEGTALYEVIEQFGKETSGEASDARGGEVSGTWENQPSETQEKPADSGKSERTQDPVESKTREDLGGDERQVKERKTVKTAHELGILNKNKTGPETRYYEVKHNDPVERAAQDYIQKVGFNTAYNQAILPSGENVTKLEHEAVQMAVIQLLNQQQMAALNAGNTELADAFEEQSQAVMRSLAPEATEAGQMIQLLSRWNIANPASVLARVRLTRAQNGLKQTLPAEMQKQLTEQAEKLQDAQAKIDAQTARIAELEQGKKQYDVKGKKTKPLTKTEKTVLDELDKLRDAAIARLRGKPELLQMAAFSDSPLADEIRSDLTDIGASILLHGWHGEPITVEQFEKELTKLFGSEYADHYRQIHAESVVKMDARIKEQKLKNRLDILQGEHPDKTVPELLDMIAKDKEQTKANAKIRAEHRKVANEFLMTPQREAEQIEREADRAWREREKELQKELAQKQKGIDAQYRELAKQEKADRRQVEMARRAEQRELDKADRDARKQLEKDFRAQQREDAKARRAKDKQVAEETAKETKAADALEQIERLAPDYPLPVKIGAAMRLLGEAQSIDDLANELRVRFPEDFRPEVNDTVADRKKKQRALNHAMSESERLYKAANRERFKERQVQRDADAGITAEARKELEQAKRDRRDATKKLGELVREAESPSGGLLHTVAQVSRASKVALLQTAITNVISTKVEQTIANKPIDTADILLQRVFKNLKNEGLAGTGDLATVWWTPKAKQSVSDEGIGEYAKGLSKHEILLRAIDEHPEYFSKFFGDFSPDVHSGVSKVLDKLMIPMRIQEFFMRDSAAVKALAQRAAMKGLDFKEIVQSGDYTPFTKADLDYALNEALSLTYALRPQKGGGITDAVFGTAVSAIRSSGMLDLMGSQSAPFINFMYNTVNKYKTKVPGIAQARLVAKTVSEAKQIKATGEEPHYIKEALRNNWTSRQIANQMWGVAALGIMLGAVRALGDRDEWYLFRIPFTKGLGRDGGSLYFDIRTQPLLAPFAFVANKFNRILSGKDAFTYDDAVGEIAEAFLGFSYRQTVDTNPLFKSIKHGALALTGKVQGGEDIDRNGERFSYWAQKWFGNEVGTLTNFLQFKTVKDIAAQFDEIEKHPLNLDEHPVLQGIDTRLPESRRILKDLIGMEVEARKNYATDKENVRTPYPILKVLGFNLRDEADLKPEPTQAEILANKLRYGSGSYKAPELADEKKKAAIKRDFRKAGEKMEAGTPEAIALKKKLSTFDADLSPGQIKYAQRQLFATDLEDAFKSLGFEQAARVWNVATPQEQKDLRKLYLDKLNNAIEDSGKSRQQRQKAKELKQAITQTPSR